MYRFVVVAPYVDTDCNIRMTVYKEFGDTGYWIVAEGTSQSRAGPLLLVIQPDQPGFIVEHDERAMIRSAGADIETAMRDALE
jgi:hypothetical protein